MSSSIIIKLRGECKEKEKIIAAPTRGKLQDQPLP